MAKLQTLAPTDALFAAFTHKLILRAADVIALTKATAYAVFPVYNASNTFPAGTRILDSFVDVETAGANGANTLTLSVGDGSSGTRFISAVDLKTATRYTGSSTDYVYTAADTVDITVGTDATDLTAVTALVAHIYLRVEFPQALRAIADPLP